MRIRKIQLGSWVLTFSSSGVGVGGDGHAAGVALCGMLQVSDRLVRGGRGWWGRDVGASSGGGFLLDDAGEFRLLRRRTSVPRRNQCRCEDRTATWLIPGCRSSLLPDKKENKKKATLVTLDCAVLYSICLVLYIPRYMLLHGPDTLPTSYQLCWPPSFFCAVAAVCWIGLCNIEVGA